MYKLESTSTMHLLCIYKHYFELKLHVSNIPIYCPYLRNYILLQKLNNLYDGEKNVFYILGEGCILQQYLGSPLD